MNTLALLLSGVALFLAHRAYSKNKHSAAQRWMGASVLLGAFFVVFQGFEWAALLTQGMTPMSSQLGAFFYLIVGMHALHAIAAIVALAILWNALRGDRLKASHFGTIQLFWYFVVLMWPLIYWQVYL